MDKGITYGILTAIALIAYFLFMKLFGLETQVWLRIFNFVILGGAIFILLNRRIRRDPAGVGYFGGLGMGIRLTVTAIVVFVLFLAVYVNFIDAHFLEVVEASKMWGADMTMDQVAVGILIEGVVSGVIITFILMQFFKGYIHPRDDA